MGEAMKVMRKNRSGRRDGMVLVVVLLVMSVLSLAGAAAMTTASIDLQITYNNRVYKQAFYAADGGIETAPKIIRNYIHEKEDPEVGAISIDDNLYDEIMGYEEGLSSDSVIDTNPIWDLKGNFGKNNYMVDIDRLGVSYAPGGGVEFAAGYQGIGAASTGGVWIIYGLDSVATAVNENANARVDAEYRYVVGVAGGK
jgi:Tfp pilus assembly protein PilX